MKRKIVTLLAILATSCCFAFGVSACNASSSETSSWAESSCGKSSEESSSQDTSLGTTESVGLQYTLNEEETYYIVSGIGTCKDANIVIPSTYDGLPVVSIEETTFYNCSNLTSITIPDSVTEIGFGAFYGCAGLTNVKIGSSVVFIKEWAFYGCIALTNIEIPDSVTTIGAYAFSNCSNLNTVKMGNSVTLIEEYTFAHCIRLKSITIPNSVTSIGRQAFTTLETVYYGGTAEEWTALKENIASNNECLTNATIYYVDGASTA